MELRQELEKIKEQLENEATKKNEKCKILDIHYYKQITFDNVEGKEEPLYLVEKEVNGKVIKQLQISDKVIADIADDNTIKIRDEISNSMKDTSILIALRDTAPISLNELEKQEKQKAQMKDTKSENDKANEEKIDKNIKQRQEEPKH